MNRRRRGDRAWRVPEIVQTSGMDCGPASLKALLGGFGIEVSYDRLREACHTDLDGSSIDTLEAVAEDLGLDVEQVMLPLDHLLLEEARAVPSIVVVRLPGGLTHFVVAWRARRRHIQVMDPANGRRRVGQEAFLGRVYVHRHRVSAELWRAWAGNGEFLTCLDRRLNELGVSAPAASRLLLRASHDKAWFPLAALDAAVRMTNAVTRSGSFHRGAADMVESLLERALQNGSRAIPPQFWFALAPRSVDAEATDEVILQGAVLVRAMGLKDEPPPGLPGGGPSPESRLASLRDPVIRPGRKLMALLLRDGWVGPLTAVWALALGGGAVIIEAVFFRGLIELGTTVGSALERLWILGGALGLLGLLLLLDISVMGTGLQMGRRLEVRLRQAIGAKLPLLEDRYLSSRLVSDFAERSHTVHRIRDIPPLVQIGLRAAFQFLFTVIGIIWIDPSLAPLALASGAVMGALPLILRRGLEERDLRLRSQGGALSRYYFDALLGLTAIRSHGAEDALRTEHEGVLRDWCRSMKEVIRWSVGSEALQRSLGFLLAVAMVVQLILRSESGSGLLLLVYWALRLPTLGEQIGSVARRLSSHRNITLRLLEPLQAPEVPEHQPRGIRTGETAEPRGVSIRCTGVTLRLGGIDVLQALDLDVPAGSHLAIVGSSGAGKSSLMGILMGWYRPTEGLLEIDGRVPRPEDIHQLRAVTAWVDPEVQLWNRSLLENLRYGNRGTSAPGTSAVIRDAELLPAIEALDQGLATVLGEGGRLVSGGEGQRVRLGRALYRQAARLVILDEAFRGLDRCARQRLLGRVRERWAEATLICVSHDLEATRDFPRVIVLDQGRSVEDGSPEELLAAEGSLYRRLCEEQRMARNELHDSRWQRLKMTEGRLEKLASSGISVE